MEIIASFPTQTPFDQVAVVAIYGLLAFGALAIPFMLWKRFVDRWFRDPTLPKLHQLDNLSESSIETNKRRLAKRGSGTV